jgi:hypothetical protein
MKRTIFLILFVCFTFSCKEEIYSTIPSAPVNLTLDLKFLDNSLNAVFAYEVFAFDKPRVATDRLGFGGILVINGVGSNPDPVNLYAYDLACPVEVSRNALVVPNDEGKATCPKCGAVYNIAYGYGTPESGTKLFLRSYRVVPSGNREYIVVN